MEENIIKAGDYVIVQRQSYQKLHKLQETGTVSLGKNFVNLSNIIGHKFFETFRMVADPRRPRQYTVEAVKDLTTTTQVSIEKSGYDNRNITDDGSSQTLTTEEICKFRDDAMSSNDILDKLITNSKTFASKTEYSQAKYIKKKEKKYFEYIQICKPTIPILTEIMYKKHDGKLMAIRIDDLSQLLAYANIQSDGNILVYDSGSSGIIPAAITHALGAKTSGRIVCLHPGNEPQRQAFAAMQFSQEQSDRCIFVNVYSVLRCFYQNENGFGNKDCKLLQKNQVGLGKKVKICEDGCENKQETNLAGHGNEDNVCITYLDCHGKKKEGHCHENNEGKNLDDHKKIARISLDVHGTAQETSLVGHGNSEGRSIEDHEQPKKTRLACHGPIKENLACHGTIDDKCNSLENLESLQRQKQAPNDLGALSKTEEPIQTAKIHTKLDETVSDERGQSTDTLEIKPEPAASTSHRNRKRKHGGPEEDEPAPDKKPQWQVSNEMACRFLFEKMDSLVVVAKEHPVNIVKELVVFLKPARWLVVYCTMKEPLQDLYVFLKAQKEFISLKLVSSFMRKYQVLPERTHPEMNMDFGGFVLTAFKLQM